MHLTLAKLYYLSFHRMHQRAFVQFIEKKLLRQIKHLLEVISYILTNHTPIV
ncbi:hypothetical protein D3C75_1344290 [compost metagenome]